MESMDGNAGCKEVVVRETANVEHLGSRLSVLAEKTVLVAALDKQNTVCVLGLDGHELLLQRCVLLVLGSWSRADRAGPLWSGISLSLQLLGEGEEREIERGLAVCDEQG